MNKNYYQSNFVRHLLGVGYDARDNHRRVTKGDHFHIFGGSEETHGEMQEKTLKLIEELGKRGKSIITASDNEFYETAMELGINIFSPENN
jgi:hypothetical protein